MTATLLDIDAETYHADTDGPTLSSSIARKLILETPAHAKQAHPLLADNYIPTSSAAMDEGTILHQMLLGDDRCDILPFDSYRTNDAKDARDESRSRGRVPVLQAKWDEMLLLGESLKSQVAAFPADPPLFVDGRAEQTIVWNEGDVRCRARLDWLRTDLATIDDLKKSRTAQPRRWQRAFWQLGYDMQAAFYLRGVRAAFDAEPVFRWVAVEPDPPYALSVFTMSPKALRAANDRVDTAIELWQQCLETGDWPAYSQATNVVEPPPWLDAVEWDDTALTDVPF